MCNIFPSSEFCSIAEKWSIVEPVTARIVYTIDKDVESAMVALVRRLEKDEDDVVRLIVSWPIVRSLGAKVSALLLGVPDEPTAREYLSELRSCVQQLREVLGSGYSDILDNIEQKTAKLVKEARHMAALYVEEMALELSNVIVDVCEASGWCMADRDPEYGFMVIVYSESLPEELSSLIDIVVHVLNRPSHEWDYDVVKEIAQRSGVDTNGRSIYTLLMETLLSLSRKLCSNADIKKLVNIKLLRTQQELVLDGEKREETTLPIIMETAARLVSSLNYYAELYTPQRGETAHAVLELGRDGRLKIYLKQGSEELLVMAQALGIDDYVGDGYLSVPPVHELPLERLAAITVFIAITMVDDDVDVILEEVDVGDMMKEAMESLKPCRNWL